MLTLSHISKSYGKFLAVEDINLELEHRLYGMLAPNGAGKTTLIKMITTLLFPSEGEILYDGIPIQKMGEKYRDRIVILSTHIVSDIESIANQVIMIKDKHLYQMDTVANICGLLDGKVYERPVGDDDFVDFEKEHLVLSARQEQEFLQVRYYSEKPEAEAKPCTPNLEDMFLVSYQ